MQCTHRLEMNNAARRMYLEDGEIVLDVEDLVRHAVDNCKNEMIDMVLLENAQKDGQSGLGKRERIIDKEIRKERKYTF